MADKIIFKGHLSGGRGFMTGLGFAKKNADEKLQIIIDMPVVDTTAQKHTVSTDNLFNHVKIKKNLTEMSPKRSKKKKEKKNKINYVDQSIDPQKIKKKGYNGYEVANKISKEDHDKEKLKLAYGS